MEIIKPTIDSKNPDIRVVSPSRSLSIEDENIIFIAENNLRKLGFGVSYGSHVYERDEYGTSSVESRVEDIHQALEDEEIDILLAAMGGYSSNQILPFIDWDKFRNNPKTFCGYSDLTVLCNSILQMAGVVAYYGPNFSSFARPDSKGITGKTFKSVFQGERNDVEGSDLIGDEEDGLYIVNEGIAVGTLIGGNLNSLNLLQGTEYFPVVEDPVFLIEEDALTSPENFDRDLESLFQSESFRNVRGLIFGKMPEASGVNSSHVSSIIKRTKKLSTIPIVGGLNFGHTDIKMTIPIGGKVSMKIGRNSVIQIQY